MNRLVAFAATLVLTGTSPAQPQPAPAAQQRLPKDALLRVGDGHVAQLAGLGLLHDGKTLLTAAKDDTLRLWDLTSGKLAGQFVAAHTRPKAVVVSPDGKTLALLTPAGKLQLRELPGGQVRREWQAETFKNVGT